MNDETLSRQTVIVTVTLAVEVSATYSDDETLAKVRRDAVEAANGMLVRIFQGEPFKGDIERTKVRSMELDTVAWRKAP